MILILLSGRIRNNFEIEQAMPAGVKSTYLLRIEK